MGLPSDLLSRRPNLGRAEHRIAAAGADLRSARADLYPRFSLTGLAGLDSGSIGNLLGSGSGVWALVPGVHLPIFNRGRLKARVKVSQAMLERAGIEFQRAYLPALEEVEGTLVRYGRLPEKARRLEEAAAAAADSVRPAEILYQRGLSDYLTGLDAQR